jgi:hypothetical protein
MPNRTIFYPWIKSNEEGVPQFNPKAILSKWFDRELEAEFDVKFPKVLNVNDN